MLTRLSLEHFKCFRNLNLPLAPLTVLSGMNASGKSTVLQSLTLLHQTIAQSEWSRTLILNGDFLVLGTVRDVLDQITGKRDCTIALETDEGEYQWRVGNAEDRLAMTLPIFSFSRRGKANKTEALLLSGENLELQFLLPKDLLTQTPGVKRLAQCLQTLTYLSADRLGPRETYSLDSVDQHRAVGARGEWAASLLYHLADDPVLEPLRLPDTSPNLRQQVHAWLQHFFPGSGLDVQRVPNTNLVTLGLRTNDAEDYHRPRNVGYGLSQVLPIFVACLSAKTESLLLLENPESHLHPSGQSAMGEFLARVASARVQLIVETHSDHILNGIRRAVKKKTLTPEQTAIHFFTPRQADDETGAAQVVSPLMDPQGNLDRWPEGFFDQFDKDNTTLLGWG